MRNEHGPLGKAWTDIGSDVNWIDYGGRWARHIEGTRYHVIRFENCSEWGDGATGYHCDLQEVDTTNPLWPDAVRSCDVELGRYEPKIQPFVMAEALSTYGAYAPLWQDGGTNAHKLLRAAKAESRLLATNSAEYEARMDRPVNKIGSTAREYATGDINSAVLRGLGKGDPAAEIMARMGMLQVVHIGGKR